MVLSTPELHYSLTHHNAKTLGPEPQGRGLPPPLLLFHSLHISSRVCQAEVCAGTVAEVIQSVVNGADGCVFCFGHAKLGQ